jgi:hypothetical protein
VAASALIGAVIIVITHASTTRPAMVLIHARLPWLP